MVNSFRNTDYSTFSLVLMDENNEVEFMNAKAEELFNFPDSEEYIKVLKCCEGAFCFVDIVCEIEISTYKNKTVFLIKDKKEMKKVEKDLERSYLVEEELNQVINSSFDGITIIDRDGIIVHQNPASEKITGLSASKLIGKSIKELVKNGTFDQSVTLKVLIENKASTIIQKTSTGKQVLVSGAPVRDKSGKILKVVCSTRDLTLLKELENNIIDLEEKNLRVELELKKLRSKYNSYDNLIANDDKTKAVIQRAHKIAQIDSAVLIKGESGVGKEGIVNLIHLNSTRRDKPLLKINCGAIPEQLLESELFGYEAGTFTGANQSGKKGLFENAQGGTIFLDELGEMPLRLQISLLRVLQEYEITRVGGVNPIKVDVRIIAATNVDLQQKIRDKKFREDLYYRINVIPITVPALRERINDIIPLVYHYQNQVKEKYGIYRTFSPSVLKEFRSQYWPGNVRELKNLVERVILMVNKKEIQLDDIQTELSMNKGLEIQVHNKRSELIGIDELVPLKQQVEAFEIGVIKKSIDNYTSIRKAAKALKVDQSTLVRKIQKYEIEKSMQ